MVMRFPQAHELLGNLCCHSQTRRFLGRETQETKGEGSEGIELAVYVGYCMVMGGVESVLCETPMDFLEGVYTFLQPSS